jgi:hypothetical protein
MNPDDAVCEKTQSDLAVFAFESNVIAVLFDGADIANNGVGCFGIAGVVKQRQQNRNQRRGPSGSYNIAV